MGSTTVTHTVEYTVTPEDVATAFVNFDDDSQARILDMIAKGFERWMSRVVGRLAAMEAAPSEPL